VQALLAEETIESQDSGPCDQVESATDSADQQDFEPQGPNTLPGPFSASETPSFVPPRGPERWAAEGVPA
jgi:hypothetical protein